MLSKQQIEEIMERRGTTMDGRNKFSLVAHYPGNNPSWVYTTLDLDGAPSNLCFTITVNADGTFELGFQPSWVFASLKMGPMGGFEDDERFKDVTKKFQKAVNRLEGCYL